MDKISKIKAYLENQKAEYRLGKSAEAKYRMEAYTEIEEFIESLSEEPASEDLKEASNNYAESEEKRVGCGTEFFTPELAEAFKAGGQWMKQQMLQDAIDAVIHPYDGEIWTDKKHLEKYDEYQTVKLIIMKED